MAPLRKRFVLRENGNRRQRGRRIRLAIGAVSICVLLMASAAQAATVTVGSVLPVSFASTPFSQVKTMFNTALPEKGANLASPVNGAVVRWRIQGAKGGPFFLRVLHPNGSGAYTATGTSLPATPTGTGVETFSTSIPIHSGDLIGIDPSNPTDEIGIAPVAGASFGFIAPPPFEGSTVAPTQSEAGQEIELSAEIQPAPAITSIAPSFGSIAGGTAVVITGTNLAGASAVKFGTATAASFTVESETQITAVAPATATPGTVDVTATTLAGTSPTVRGDNFTYTACIVPKVKGKKLKQAKRAIRNAGCKPGSVTGQKVKAAKVVKQNPKPGTILVPDSSVNVKLAVPKPPRAKSSK